MGKRINILELENEARQIREGTKNSASQYRNMPKPKGINGWILLIPAIVMSVSGILWLQVLGAILYIALIYLVASHDAGLYFRYSGFAFGTSILIGILFIFVPFPDNPQIFTFEIIVITFLFPQFLASLFYLFLYMLDDVN